jgi:hypothetical protein
MVKSVKPWRVSVGSQGLGARWCYSTDARRLFIIAPLVLLSLTACEERPRLALPPANLATCADEPEAPALPAQDWTAIEAARPVQLLRDTLMLDYVLALRGAWGGCRSKVDGLKAWRETVDR